MFSCQRHYAAGLYGCQLSGFDPKSQGFGLKSPGSGFNAEISWQKSTLQQKNYIFNFPLPLAVIA